MAAFDPGNRKQMAQLASAIGWSYKKLEPFRKHALASIKQYVGNHYSDDGAPDRVPLNMIEMAANIYATQLAANVPKALVLGNHSSLSRAAYDLELALNHLLHEIKLGNTLRCLVVDALFNPFGCVKVGLGTVGEIEIDGIYHDIGQPFVDPVNFEDIVFDMTALRMEAVQFMGNRYILPIEDVRANPEYENTDELEEGSETQYTPSGDSRLRSLTYNESSAYQDGGYIETVELLDVWLPRDGLVVTLPWRQHYEGGTSPVPVKVVEWNGPESGPYKMLSFNEVPGQLLAVSPAATWVDLHELINAIYRKLGRQAERQKDVLTYTGPAKDDAERIRKVSDGEMIQVDNPNGTNLEKFGGVDQTNLAFGVHLKDLFTYQAGNLDMLGGLSPQSDTLGQDKLLSENASKRLGSMQKRTVEVASEIVESLAWYLWTDPLIELPLAKRVPGAGSLKVESMWSAESREGDFLDYNFTIEPYSMSHKSPGDRLASLQRVMQNYIIPFMEPLSAQGGQLDFEQLLRIVAKYEDMKEIDDILFWINRPPESPEGTGEESHDPKRPGVVHTINERINRPGGTRANKDNALMQTLLGGGVQGSRMKSAMGPNV